MSSSYFTDSFVDGDLQLISAPPRSFLALMVVELAISAVCFSLNSDSFHWVGYAVAAGVTSLTAIAHRQFDRKRSRLPSYIPERWVGRAIAALLVAGLAIAAMHAYFLAQYTRFE